MALNDTNSYLSTLINAGADAMTNLYFIKFRGGYVDNDPNLSMALTVRAQNISLPKPTHPVNTINFMTVSLDTPKADIGLDKTFSITFRLDSNYGVYKYLLKQQAETSIPNLGFATNRTPDESTLTGADGSNYGLTVSVYAANNEILNTDQEAPELDASTNRYSKLYEFRHCWISAITPIGAYDYDSSNPLTVTATFFFYDYDDPQSLLLK